MIEKERLQELIEQEATIYSTHWQEEVDLSLPCEINEVEYGDRTITRLVVFEDDEHAPSYMLDNLTEDIEGAKWEEEFGCIERTERLELPTWEEFSKLKANHIRFISKKGAICRIEGFCDDKSGFIDVVSGGYSMLMVSDYSKETYINACRKAKELFLGEKK